MVCVLCCWPGIKVNPGSTTKKVVREQDGTLTLHLTNGEVSQSLTVGHRDTQLLASLSPIHPSIKLCSCC